MSDESAMEVKAALAEALHVDGAYALAAALWAELADADHRPEESQLKAALASLAQGDEATAARRFEQAVAAGAPASELDYVRGHRAWKAGDVHSALAAFASAERAGPAAPPANAAAAVLAAEGRTREALMMLQRALEADPDDGCALANVANLRGAAWGHDRSEAVLTRAARAAPHRAEPFLVHARSAERAGRLEDALDSRAKAVLRTRSMGAVPATIEAPAVRVVGAVEGHADADGLHLAVRLVAMPGAAVSETFRLNAGWQRVHVEGGGEHAAGRLRVDAGAWRPDGAARVLRLTLGGVPEPPCVHLDAQGIEVGGPSAWLPVPEEGPPIVWSGRVEPSPDQRAFLCGDTASYLAVPPGPDVELGSDGTPRVRALGAAEPTALRRAALLAAHTAAAWTELAGECPLGAVPPLVSVERGKSSFCYTTSRFVRIPRAVMEDDRGLPLVAHETGHAWWGAGVRFATGTEWLAEALAEYSLHLLEDRGLLTAHRERSLALLARLAGELPDRALVKLSAEPGVAAQLALRVKGGFAIASLRRLLGEQAFSALLRATIAAARHAPMDDYTFFALASRLHGSSVTWLANQWAYARASLSLSGELAGVERVGERYGARIVARARGALMLAGPLEVAVLDAEGEISTGEVDVVLGSGDVVVWTRRPPTHVLLDPHHRCYATRAEVLIEQPAGDEEGSRYGAT